MGIADIWLYVGVIAIQTGMLIYCSYWMNRSTKIIDELNEGLRQSTRDINLAADDIQKLRDQLRQREENDA